VFVHALQSEIVSCNPVALVEKPQAKNKTEARILEAHEVRALLDAAPEKYRLLLTVTAYTGLRQSEVLGLRWQDVDFENGVLHVRHQLSRAKANEPAKLIPLKTRAGERWIELAPELSRELAKHSLASSFSQDDDFVFTTETGKPLYYRNVSARGLDKAADRASQPRGRREAVVPRPFGTPRSRTSSVQALTRRRSPASPGTRRSRRRSICTWASGRSGGETTLVRASRRSTRVFSDRPPRRSTSRARGGRDTRAGRAPARRGSSH
jgi:Phage integrase family